MDHKTFELKETNLSEDGTIEGYGAIFGNVDNGGDRLARGSIKLRGDRAPKMLYQHRPSDVIGVWDSVTEDAKGLRVKGRLLLDLAKAKEVRTLLQAKALDGLSIGYITKRARRVQEEGKSIRLLEEIDLHEISVVTFPMNEAATVSDIKQMQSADAIIELLADGGVPRDQAELIARFGYDGAKQHLLRPEGPPPDQLDKLMNQLNELKEQFKCPRT